MFNIPTSQGIVNVTIPTHTTWFTTEHEPITKVGIKLSGGADSAILTYILALCKKQFRPEVELIPITSVNPRKPCQEVYAKRVLSKVTELTGVEFGEHYVQYASPDIGFGEAQLEFILSMYDKDIFQCHFYGETLNPDPNDESFVKIRTDNITDNQRNSLAPIVVNSSTRPFRHIDKRAVKELYDYFEVLEELFPLTRSCEALKKPNDGPEWLEHHCGKCWFCNERLWGFGRYV